MCKRLTTKEFLERSKVIHGNKYDYKKVVYINTTTKVSIFCNKHKEYFWQTPKNHIRGFGCQKCKKEKTGNRFRKTQEKFIKDAIKIHRNKYSYEKVDYVNCKEKVLIYCNAHKKYFLQTPDSHLNNRGCHSCGKQKNKSMAQKSPTGWSNTNWEAAAKKSKYFNGFKVYVVRIRIRNTNECFWKIGKTFTTIKQRFMQANISHSSLLEIKCNSAKEATTLEAKLKRLSGNIKYLPNEKFAGMYECFSELNFEEILKNSNINEKEKS